MAFLVRLPKAPVVWPPRRLKSLKIVLSRQTGPIDVAVRARSSYPLSTGLSGVAGDTSSEQSHWRSSFVAFHRLTWAPFTEKA